MRAIQKLAMPSKFGKGKEIKILNQLVMEIRQAAMHF